MTGSRGRQSSPWAGQPVAWGGTNFLMRRWAFSAVRLPFPAADWLNAPSFRQDQPLDWAAPGKVGRCAAAARGDAAGRDGPGIIFISLFPGEKKKKINPPKIIKKKPRAREPPAGADGAAVSGAGPGQRGAGAHGGAGRAGQGRTGGGREDEAAERGLQQTAAAPQAEPHHRGHLRQVPSGKWRGERGGTRRRRPGPRAPPRLLSGSPPPLPCQRGRDMAACVPSGAAPPRGLVAPPLGRTDPSAGRCRAPGPGESAGGAAGQGPVGAAGRKRRGEASPPWLPLSRRSPPFPRGAKAVGIDEGRGCLAAARFSRGGEGGCAVGSAVAAEESHGCSGGRCE